MNSSKLTINIVRYDPGTEGTRTVCSYQVPDRPGMTVLEALYYIWAHQDPDLAFRYACKVQRCAACAIRVNGKACLACSTPAKDGMLIEPVSGGRLIRDLVTDIFSNVEGT